MNDYLNIFYYVENYMEQHDNNVIQLGNHSSFIKYSDHIWRVFVWTNRLFNDAVYPDIHKNAVLIAALFHDTGYGICTDVNEHAQNSVTVFNEYSKTMELNSNEKEMIIYLILNHSKKELLKLQETPIELKILMEADLLDETGALSIVWNCMAVGAEKGASFEKSYKAIGKYSKRILTLNPMVTEKGKKYWEKKQELVKTFSSEFWIDMCKEISL